MRGFSFITSIAGFCITLLFLIADFPALDEFGGIVYLSLFVVLLLICITGIISNRPGRKYTPDM